MRKYFALMKIQSYFVNALLFVHNHWISSDEWRNDARTTHVCKFPPKVSLSYEVSWLGEGVFHCTRTRYGLPLAESEWNKRNYVFKVQVYLKNSRENSLESYYRKVYLNSWRHKYSLNQLSPWASKRRRQHLVYRLPRWPGYWQIYSLRWSTSFAKYHVMS